jgi:hypothetical protein
MEIKFSTSSLKLKIENSLFINRDATFLKKKLVHHKILICVVFYNLKVILLVSDTYLEMTERSKKFFFLKEGRRRFTTELNKSTVIKSKNSTNFWKIRDKSGVQS